MEIFGFSITKKTPKVNLEVLEIDNDGDTTIIEDDGVGSYAGVLDGTGVGLERPADEVEKIRNYREIAASSEVDEALTEIRNEVFVFDVPGKKAFQPEFLPDEESFVTPAIREKIMKEFDLMYSVTEFHDRGIEYFNRWYIDGRLYMQKVVEKSNAAKGIRRVQVLDPLNIRKIKLVPRENDSLTINSNNVDEFYAYSRRFDSTVKFGVTNVMSYGAYTQAGARIKPDAIAYADSSLRDLHTGRVVSNLDKVIVPYNNLKMMEDAMVIFRVVRAPQRRAIYVDVGNLQKNKSDSYMKEVMARFKNRMTYDSKTGTLSDRRNVLSMIEDYWLPRREGSKGTEIQTLEGQDANGTLEEVEYYRDKLWRSLGVPRSRFGENAQSFVFGRGIEIQRDEYRFKKFLNHLRRYFLVWFEDVLKTQIVLKKIILEEEWETVRRSFFWTFAEDNAFVEFKESEIINSRIGTLASIDPYVGKYFSIDWVRRNVLHQTVEEIKANNKDMDTEEAAGMYDKDIEDDNNQFGGGTPSGGTPQPNNKPVERSAGETAEESATKRTTITTSSTE
mgnify:FL=1